MIIEYLNVLHDFCLPMSTFMRKFIAWEHFIILYNVMFILMSKNLAKMKFLQN